MAWFWNDFFFYSFYGWLIVKQLVYGIKYINSMDNILNSIANSGFSTL